MKNIFILLILLSTLTFAQTYNRPNLPANDTSHFSFFFILEDERGISSFHEAIMGKRTNVKSSDFLSREQIIEKYGEQFSYVLNGVVIRPKRGVKYLSFAELLKIYHISLQPQNAPVYLDNNLINKPATIISEREQISNIWIATDDRGNQAIFIQSTIGKQNEELRKKYPLGRDRIHQ